MYSKEQIYQLALGALLLTRQVTDTTTDRSNEVAVLNIHWSVAFLSALQEMDLDSTSQRQTLELVQTFQGYDQNGVIDGSVPTTIPWYYAYKYPSNCAFFRRIVSGLVKDNRYTHIPKQVGLYNGQKVIFTNQEQAIAEIIPSDISLAVLSPPAALAVAYKLALTAAPLITGKGANELRQQIDAQYKMAAGQAQAQEANESFSYESDDTQSEFVASRYY